MSLSKAQLDELIKDYKTPEEMESVYTQMLQHMINKALQEEMTAHLGHHKHARSTGNTRNGSTAKTVRSTQGNLVIHTPRDREGSFEPQLVSKRQTRLGGMEDKILALYAKGNTTRDIESLLKDLYGVEISHSVISQITEVLREEALAWQHRALDAIYPIVWLDGIVIKIRHHKQVINKSAHVVLGVNMRGEKEVLGLWIAENEGAKFQIWDTHKLRYLNICR
jgi:putative transposase